MSESLPRKGATPAEVLLLIGLLVLLGTELVEVALGKGAGARAGYGMIYLAALALALRRIGCLALLANTAPLLALLLLFPMFSMLWSVNPAESFQHGVAVLFPSLIGIYLSARFRLPAIILIVAGAYALIAVLDYALAAAVPSMGRMNGAEWHGAWKGLHSHKTALGKSASIGALFTLYALMLARGSLRWAFAGALVLQLALLTEAHALAALLALILAVTFMLWLSTMKMRSGALLIGSTLAALAVLAGLGLFLSMAGLPAVLEVLGKNATMSSRLPLWQAVTDSVAHSPWLGYGMAAFWQSDLPDLARIRSAVRFEPHYAHNGLLEMMLDGGVLLVALFAAVFASAFGKAVALFKRSPIEGSLPLVFLLTFLAMNFAEASVLGKNSLFWVVFVALAAHVAHAVRLRLRDAGPPLPQRLAFPPQLIREM